ncbi:gamma carbonic anhydrase family protein [Robiginitalea sp. SC105]|uniref:gamma carbonic anhydrase family protein n=1 Tax=Robiginitalea sp. SC105 TaxID=2762332 RepID=UPI0016396FF6|nr:gamma carbonic anhydrase family protein [Robiginitalea sp. SC105]MBC2838811.1 gamma carbonic anhydrase family protein [Robiginitalea sp. SC105]
MSIVKSVRGKAPQIGEDCYLADNAVVVGDVVMGDRCSVWFNAVVRGDVNSIRMGHQVNVQDGAVIHCTFEKAATQIGDNVSIGHNAIVHGCTVRDNVLIGMGSIVMDHCDVGSYSIIAAGAVVPQGTVVPEGSIFAGVPARKIGEVRPELRTGEIERIAKAYIRYSGWFKDGGGE